MFYSIILSLIFHIFILIMITMYNYFFNCDIIYFNQAKNNYKIVTLLPMNSIIINSTLETKYPVKKIKTIHSKKSSELKCSKIKKESLKKINNISNFSNDLLKNNQNNFINSNNNFSTNKEEIKIFNKIDTTNCYHITKNPNFVKYVHPVYPSAAKTLGIEGKLQVMYDINHVGKVENIKVLFASPEKIFEKNVKLAMRRWIYEKSNPKKKIVITFKFSVDNISFL